jgi:hypothetical protein
MSEPTPVLDCGFPEESAPVAAASREARTVGQEFALHCQGAPPAFDVAQLKVEALNQAEYTVRLLKYEAKGDSVEAVLTSYRVGEFKDVELLFTDGAHMAKTKPLSWQVKSVIDPQNPKAAEPFGPFGPWKISWPWWYFLILILMLAALVLAAVRTYRLARRKLELRRRIEEYRRKFNPFDQFQKALRRLDRELQKPGAQAQGVFDELRRESLLYFMMEFGLDTEKSSARKIVRKLRALAPKARDSIFADLALFLAEFQKKGDATEVEKMIDWAGRISEKFDRESLGIR